MWSYAKDEFAHRRSNQHHRHVHFSRLPKKMFDGFKRLNQKFLHYKIHGSATLSPPLVALSVPSMSSFSLSLVAGFRNPCSDFAEIHETGSRFAEMKDTFDLAKSSKWSRNEFNSLDDYQRFLCQPLYDRMNCDNY